MEIKKIGVLGAGVMGQGIGQLCAQNGYDVIMGDISDDVIAASLKRLQGTLAWLVEKGRMTEAEKTSILARIKPTPDISAVAGADYVIEAVFEDIEVKKNVFKDLDRLARPSVILATNTSTLSVTEIASVTKRPDKVIGMHFFNPPPLMRLVEVIRGYLTSDETVSISRELAERGLGKETVTIKKDTPGFIVNRAFIPYLIEAMRIYEEGVSSPEDIDKAIKLGLNVPMGPFELMDLMGNDTNLAVFSALEKELGHEFSFRVPYSLKVQVMAKHLGRKTGRGWHKYENK